MINSGPTHAPPASNLCEWCGLIAQLYGLAWSQDLGRWLCEGCKKLDDEDKLEEKKVDLKATRATVETMMKTVGITVIDMGTFCPKCNTCHTSSVCPPKLSDIVKDILETPGLDITIQGRVDWGSDGAYMKIICERCVQAFGFEAVVKCEGMREGKDCRLWDIPQG